jgi:hypothetical protein
VRDFFQRLAIGVDADEKGLWIQASVLVNQQTVAGSNINYSLRVRSDEFLKVFSTDLSDGFTAD